MDIPYTANRIHPLVAGATASVMLVSLLGAAAITGLLPVSNGTSVPSAPSSSPNPAVQSTFSTHQVPVQPAQAAPTIHHKVIVHHRYVTQSRTTAVAQASPPASYAPAPAYREPIPSPQPVAQNSPVGIGGGAVVGGLLGSQVGGGHGKTLATIAGAVGGGYVGNEIAKRY